MGGLPAAAAKTTWAKSTSWRATARAATTAAAGRWSVGASACRSLGAGSNADRLAYAQVGAELAGAGHIVVGNACLAGGRIKVEASVRCIHHVCARRGCKCRPIVELVISVQILPYGDIEGSSGIQYQERADRNPKRSRSNCHLTGNVDEYRRWICRSPRVDQIDWKGSRLRLKCRPWRHSTRKSRTA